MMNTRTTVPLVILTTLLGCAATGGDAVTRAGTSGGSETVAIAASGRPRSEGKKFGTKGAPWTIRLIEIQGTERARSVAQFAETLKNTPGIRAQDVFHQNDTDGYSRLYYGTYYRQLDAKSGKHTTPPQLSEDLALIKQLGDPSGQRYFFAAIPVRKPQPDVGDSAWNLANVNAQYSLQVAAFEPTDDFWEYKQAAVEYVKQLREQGYEAYYHHSPTSSVVTVGAFGADALVVDSRGYTNYSQEVQRLQQNEKFKYNLLNGRIYYVVEGGQRMAVPSSIVATPKNAEMGMKNRG
jgi:hypothetical protein